MQTILFAFTVVALCCTMNAATKLVAPDGTRYSFGDWSSPEAITLKSDAGDVGVVRRTSLLSRMDTAHTLCFSMDVLYSPAMRAVWLGPSYDHYFAIGGRLYGAATKGSALLLTAGDVADAENLETIMESALTQFVNDPRTSFSVLGATHAFDLTRIFGWAGIFPENDARAWLKPVAIKGITIEPRSITFRFETVAGSELNLVFSPDFEIISAAKNGKPILVLQNGKFPLAHDWPGPKEIRLASTDGPIAGLGSSKVYYTDGIHYSAQTAPGWRAYPIKAAVVPATGDMWIGPIDSKLVVSRRGIVGFLLNERHEVLVFAARGSRIPIGRAASAAFQQELSKFEMDLLSGRFLQNLTVNIPSMFPHDQIVSKAADVSLNGIGFEDSDIVLRLSAGSADGHREIEVKMSPELRVIAADKIR